MENTKLSWARNPIVILIIGVVAVLVIRLLGPVAWILGNRTLQGMPVGTPQRGLVVAGRIMGMIATALFVLSMVFLVFKVIIPGI